MTILAFGCSIMHGAELIHPHQNNENTQFAYPKLVADKLGVDCKNFAVCGISNEGIFHKFFEEINKADAREITAVILGWTGFTREYWKSDDREWFIIPSWCMTTTHLYDPTLIIKDYTDKNINNHPRVCADSKEYLDLIENQYNFLMKYKFDHQQYKNKTHNYVESVRAYCRLKNIKILETCALWSEGKKLSIDIDQIGEWRKAIAHPNKKEHQLIAEKICEFYKL